MRGGLDDAIDDLSLMLQLFKDKTLYIQKLLYSYVHQYYDQSNTDQAKQYLGVLFCEQQGLVQKYTGNQSRSLKMVIYRFFSRIIEVIQHDRERVRNRIYCSLSEYYNDLENLIYSVVSVGDGDYVKTLSAVYQRSREFSANLIQQLDEKNRKYMVKPRVQPVVLEIPEVTVLQENPEKKPEPKKTPKIVQVHSEPVEETKINPIMLGLRVLDCMGLDTGIFRSTYLYCKHHDKIVYDQCLERNDVTGNTIIAYRKEYADWQIGKNRNNFQASRRLSRQSSSSPLRMVPQTSASTRRPYFKLYDRKYISVPGSKQNSTLDRSKTVSGDYHKASLSPTKVLLTSNKLSLKPQSRKYSASNTPRKRCRVRSSSQKASQSFQILIQGQRIYQQDSRRLACRLIKSSNLFC